MYNELIGAGKRGRSGNDIEKEKEKEERKKKQKERDAVFEAEHGRTKAAEEAAKWIQQHRPEGAGSARMEQLLHVLRLVPQFIVPLVQSSKKREIANWLLIPEFFRFVWNNPYFWFIYLQKKCTV